MSKDQNIPAQEDEEIKPATTTPAPKVPTLGM